MLEAQIKEVQRQKMEMAATMGGAPTRGRSPLIKSYDELKGMESSVTKPKKTAFHHPQLEYVVEKIIHSPYMTRPIDQVRQTRRRGHTLVPHHSLNHVPYDFACFLYDFAPLFYDFVPFFYGVPPFFLPPLQYPNSTFKIPVAIDALTKRGIKYKSIPKDRAPFDFTESRRTFVREVINFRPHYGGPAKHNHDSVVFDDSVGKVRPPPLALSFPLLPFSLPLLSLSRRRLCGEGASTIRAVLRHTLLSDLACSPRHTHHHHTHYTPHPLPSGRNLAARLAVPRAVGRAPPRRQNTHRATAVQKRHAEGGHGPRGARAVQEENHCAEGGVGGARRIGGAQGALCPAWKCCL